MLKGYSPHAERMHFLGPAQGFQQSLCVYLLCECLSSLCVRVHTYEYVHAARFSL